MHYRCRTIGVAAAALAVFVPSLSAQAAPSAAEGEEFFEKKIRPVLAAKCYSCHSSKLKEPLAGLRLDTPAGLRNPKLVTAITYENLDLKMPPTGKLPGETIADFRRWAAMGSPAPSTGGATAPEPSASGIDWQKARDYWAFRPVAKPALPAVQATAWPRRPIDHFLLAALEAKSLAPAPEADRRVWLRRVTFDLTGLPPKPADLAAFLADSSPEAYEKIVDRLLRSPQYGERWARHWLDLVRFAETNGHEFDNTKTDAWLYRDYVIRAFNEDLPYDRFVREQIAGDLLAQPRISEDGARLESPIGTGIYWFGEVLNSATDSVKSRADQVDNQIDVISKTFLGLTVSCARCHDHKFDPIPTADYYALAGIMHSTGIQETVVDSPLRRAEIARMWQVMDPVQPRRIDAWKPREGDDLFEDFLSGAPNWGAWTVAGQAFGNAPESGISNSARYGGLAPTGSLTSAKFKMPKLWVHVRMRGANLNDRAKGSDSPLRVTVVADDHKSIHFFPTGKQGWEWCSGRMTKEIGRTCSIEIVDRSTEGYLAVDRIVISDNDKPPADEDGAGEEPWALTKIAMPESHWAMVARDENPSNVRLHIRGSHKNLGEEQPRGVLRVIEPAAAPIPAHASGRLELARWLTDPANPLTPRVLVNRIWKHHFGHGLVRTVDNFGKTGERPSNPALLDYLAATFLENNWSIKKLHREIVLSSAYRMSSRPGAAHRALVSKFDPRNDLLSFMPVRRLEAEAIRDAMLAVSGRLNPAQFGPGVGPHISKYQDGRGKPASGPLDGLGRRGIYIQARRNFLTPMFLAFDYPLPISTIGARGVSTVPSQALLMMNNELVAELAAAWGKQVAMGGATTSQGVAGMYEQAFARPPEPDELKEAEAFLNERPLPAAWGDLAHVLFNSAEFIYVQ